MEVFIKNMVCNRCIMVVRNLFTSAGLPPSSVILGQVTLPAEASPGQMEKVEQDLNAVGFEILTTQKRRLVEQIRAMITEAVQSGPPEKDRNLSDVLSRALHKEYSYLSKLFSEAEGITIEKFYIDQKTERVKELLAYDEKSLNDIAFELGYSSVAHLSAQFKKITGFTPSSFKKLKDHHRRPLA